LNYEDEEYVRYFTRETVTWAALGWEGQCVLALMLHGKFDRAGVFDCDGHDPSHAVTLLTRIPIDVTRVGLERLFETKTWVLRDGKIIWPRFVEAQTCRRSDKARQKESREIRRQSALAGTVTGGDNPSHAITRRHTLSQHVTQSRAETEQKQSRESTRAGKPREPKPKSEPKSWSRFPKDFVLTEDLLQLARDWSLDPALEHAKILDHEFKPPRKDPAATWRNWIRNSKNGIPPQKSANDPQSTARQATTAAEIARRDAEHKRSLRERTDSAELSGIRDASELTRDLFGGSHG
jgi:hypothetical protein